MPTCPDGHQSTAADFCDICGMRIEGAPATVTAGSGASGSGASGSGAGGSGGEACPQCGSDRSGQFCEVCGFDYNTGQPAPGLAAQAAEASPAAFTGGAPDPVAQQYSPVSGASAATTVSPVSTDGAAGTGSAGSAGAQAAVPGWTAAVTADHDYYEAVVAAGGPDAGSIEFPSYCPERRFALTGKEMRIGRRSTSRGLEPEIDLTGPPTDPGISHLHAVLIAQPDGTWSVLDPGSSNGTQVNGDDISTGVEVPLHPGDRVCLGAWTVLTIQSN